MGQRANLILVRDGEYKLYYSHWCANTLDCDLFWGPEETQAFIERQEPTEEWLDDRWSEGGVIMDFDQKILLWYGGEDIMYDIPLRRKLFALMQPLWNGWELRWANAGIVDMAKYLNFPLDQVRTVEYSTKLETSIRPQPIGGFIRTIASIVLPNGELRIFPLHEDFHKCLLKGPSVIQLFDLEWGQKELRVAEWCEDFPDQGFHLDTRLKTLDIWYAGADADIISHVKKCWPDWKVTDLADQYEVQSRLTGNAVIFEEKPKAVLNLELKKMLLSTSTSSSAETIKFITIYYESLGKKVEVNPHALIDHPQEMPLNTREAKFEYALSQIEPDQY